MSAWGNYLFSNPPEPASPRGPIRLRIASGTDSTGGRKILLDMWNSMNPDCRAEFIDAHGAPPAQRTFMEDHARNHKAEVLNLDVIHVPQFAAEGWIIPLTPEDPQDFLKPLHRTCRSPGDDTTYYAIPFNTDCGVLFHRTPLGVKVDATAPLPNLRTLLTSAAPHADTRWIAQLPLNTQVYGEAFVCNVLEHALARNGAVLDIAGKPSEKVTEWNQALTPLRRAMRSQRIIGVTDAKTSAMASKGPESASVEDFTADKARIMRNWPVKFADLEAHRRSAGEPWRIDVTSLPYSILGGQNLAVVSGSPFEAEAKALVAFLTGTTAQRILASYGFVPTRNTTYDDGTLETFVPHLNQLREVVNAARPRPVTAKYGDFSLSVQRHVRAFLAAGRDFTDEFIAEIRRAVN